MKKNVKDVILSLILPRKMYRFHDLKIIYSVLIFIVSTFILLFSVNISTPRFMKNLIGVPDFENYHYEVVEDESDAIPKYKIATSHSGNLYLDCEQPGINGGTDNFRGVYNIILKDNERSNKIILTTVFYEDLDLFSSKDSNISQDSLEKLKSEAGFDLNGYINQKREDKTTYILYLFSTKSFYYLYNLGQTYTNGKWVDASNIRYTSFEYNSTDNTYKYYLPKDNTELVLDAYGNYDTSFWTVEATKDATASFDESIISSRRLVNDVRKALSNGEYIYGNVETDLINQEKNAINFSTNSDIVEVLQSNVELMADCDANIQKNMYSFFVVLINVIFPVIWVAITWLLSRKFIMNKFSEYYAICSITYITTSIVGFIFGFFVSFDKLMLFLLMIELLYYIFVTFRINTDPKILESNNNDDNDHREMPKLAKPEVNFKKVQSDDAYHVE